MTRYRLSVESGPLRNLRVENDGSWAFQPLWVQRDCTNRNAVIDLLLGEGRFSSDWDIPQVKPGEAPPPADPDFAVPCLDGICFDLRRKQSPYTPMDVELVRDRICRVARVDPDHPIVKHWEVLRAGCYTGDAVVQEWPQVAAAIEAGLQARKDAEAAAAWAAQAKAEREAEEKRLAEAQAKAKHDAEFAAASLANTPSGYRVDNSASIITTSDDAPAS